MASEKSQKEKSIFLALLLFIGAAVLIFAYLGSEESVAPKGRGTSAVAKSEKFEKSVNRHLMLTNEKMEMARQRMQLENARLMHSSRNTESAQPYVNESRLDLSSDTRATEIAEELGRGSRKEELHSPDDIVQKELFDAAQMEEYSQAYKEEYARQFVENARRGGYHVILSEDLSQVISVKPLRKPSNGMNLFNDGTGAVQ